MCVGKDQFHIKDVHRGGGGLMVSPWVAKQQCFWPPESELGKKSAKIQEKGPYIYFTFSVVVGMSSEPHFTPPPP